MSCPRVTYVWACLQLAFAGHLQSPYKWCFDATTYEIRDGASGGKIIIQYDKSDNSPIRNTAVQESLAVFIKWMFLGSAFGEYGALFFLFAIDTMGPDDYYFHEVQCLSGTSDVLKTGYVACAHSRAGNAGLWKQYFIQIVVPQLVTSSRAFALKVGNLVI